MSQIAANVTKVDDRTIFDALLERENLGSTGFGSSVALPHGRISELDKVAPAVSKVVAGTHDGTA